MRVAAFESRRASEMARLIESQGAEALVAPSLREVPLAENPAVAEFAADLLADRFGLVIFLTGVGTRFLFQLAVQRHPREELVAALAHTTVAVRGPKPLAALREYGVTPAVSVPEPNTWRELVAELDRRAQSAKPPGPLAGRRVAVQEFGAPSPELVAALEARGAAVTTVPVYRWAMPDDLDPLRRAIAEIAAGRVDLVLFTNAMQVTHLFRVASGEGRAAELLEALKRIVVASIGPTSSNALAQHGVKAALEPSHPRMGLLVKEAIEQAPALLAARRP